MPGAGGRDIRGAQSQGHGKIPQMRTWQIWALVIVLAAAAGGAYLLRSSSLFDADGPPPGIASGNGRIEADRIDVATKIAGRVAEIRVEEGALVAEGDVLALIRTAELEAQLHRAEAARASAEAAVAAAEASVARAEAQLQLAREEERRAEQLNARDVMSNEELDIRRTEAEVAAAELREAKALHAAKRKSVEAEAALAEEIRTRIEDGTLTAPVRARVLYRLAEPGEVLGSGGKVVTLLALDDVYMEFFLPAGEAPRVEIGDEARIVLDVLPDTPIPARVSFVSPQAQFTPKEVETREARESLMFRIRVRVPEALVAEHVEQVKTGVRGVAYVRLRDPDGTARADWPEWLATAESAASRPEPGGE